MKLLLSLALCALSVNAYWLMGIEDFITTERIDPIVSPGQVASHAHSVLGGSNFRFNTSTASLRQSQCTSIPIPQDKSAYWFPHLYFQWNNGSFTSLTGGAVIGTPGVTTAFPDDFRMISGTPSLRTYDASSSAQRAVTFLCLDFNGVSKVYNYLPPTACPSGIRAQINFPSCWDGKNVDSADHKSHVAFLSGGPDSGTCNDPKFPVVLPRIFMEVYWNSNAFDSVRSQAMNSTQPFVFSNGDPTGYGYHADFINGWDAGVLQNAVDKCHCNNFGDATCCVDQGIFGMNKGQNCYITDAIAEQTTGTLLKLPGNNPVQPEGKTATAFVDNVIPPLIAPVFAYTGNTPTATGQIVTPAQTKAASNAPVAVPNPPAPTPPAASVPNVQPVPTPSSSAISVPPVVVPPVATPPAAAPPAASPPAAAPPSAAPPSAAPPAAAPPVAAPSGSPPASILVAVPTASQAPPVLPPAASHTAPGNPIHTCRERSSKRQIGLEHHRRHRRQSHI